MVATCVSVVVYFAPILANLVECQLSIDSEEVKARETVECASG